MRDGRHAYRAVALYAKLGFLYYIEKTKLCEVTNRFDADTESPASAIRHLGRSSSA